MGSPAQVKPPEGFEFDTQNVLPQGFQLDGPPQGFQLDAGPPQGFQEAEAPTFSVDAYTSALTGQGQADVGPAIDLPAPARAVPRGFLDTAATGIEPYALSRRRARTKLEDFGTRAKNAASMDENGYNAFLQEIAQSELPATRKSQIIQSARAVRAGKVSDVPDFASEAATNPPQEAIKVVREFGKQAFPLSPEEEAKLSTQVGRAIGSTGAFAASRLIPGGQTALPVFAGSVGAGESIQNAAQDGATDEQQAKNGLAGIAPGLTDVVPIERLLKPVLRTPGLRGAIYAIARKMIEQGLIEGTQEGVQQFMQNAIQKISTSPDKPLLDQVGENAGVGALVGILFGGAAGVSQVASEAPAAPQTEPTPGFTESTQETSQSPPAGFQEEPSQTQPVNEVPRGTQLEIRPAAGVSVNEDQSVVIRPAERVQALDEVKAERKAADMTPEEVRAALIKDELTGLPNRRAYIESEKKPVQVSLDVDSLSWVNNNLTHDAGNALLQAVGRALQDAKADAYHISGDEFILQADSNILADQMLDAVTKRLSESVLTIQAPDGAIVKLTPGVSYGRGETLTIAERELIKAKLDRAQAGLRATRGAPPPGLVTIASERVQADRNLAAPAPQAELNDVVKTGTSGTLYSGIPVEAIGESAKAAALKAADTAGIPDPSLEIIKPDTTTEPGIFTIFRSPNRVAAKFPKFKPYFDMYSRAQEVQERLRADFNKRLGLIDSELASKSKTDLGAQYRRNKKLLAEILFAEDANGATFKETELKSLFGANDEVIKARRLLRSAYDHALFMANKTRELRGKLPINRREGYIPHFFHNYFLIVDGEVSTSAKTLRQAISMANPLARSGRKVTIRAKQFQFPGEDINAAIVGDRTYFKLKNEIESKFELTPEEGQQLLEGIARLKGRSRFVGNFLQRKGVSGFETDLDWVNRHYFNMISRYIALDPAKSRSISRFEREFGPFEKDHKGIAKYAKDYINDINGVPTAAENLLNTTIKNTPALGKFLGAYFGDRPSLQLAGMTTNAVAIAKLGLYNVSAGLVNGTQFINTQALLGPKYAAIGIARAAKVGAELSKRRLGFSPRIREELGILRKAGVEVQQGLEAGSGYSRAGQLGPLFRASTLFFRSVENSLRRSTVLGAYYKGIAEGMSREQAIEYARDTNTRVNFDYSIADAPDFIRRSGPIGQVLFQFKKFPVKQLEFMASLKGAELPRFWIPFALIAGYYAFPGMEFLRNILKEMFGWDLELWLKQHLIEWAKNDPEKLAIAKTIMYGAFANDKLGGIDISKRVGGGDFIPAEPSDLLGPAVSSTVRAVQLGARGEWKDALRAVSTAPGNVVNYFYQDGEITSPWDRNRLVTRVDEKGQVWKMLGFRTAKEAIETDKARIIQYVDRRISNERKEIIDEIIKGAKLAETDDEAAEEVIAKAIDRADRLGIPLSQKQIANEIKNKNLTRSERAFLNSSKQIQGRLAEVMEFDTETSTLEAKP